MTAIAAAAAEAAAAAAALTGATATTMTMIQNNLGKQQPKPRWQMKLRTNGLNHKKMIRLNVRWVARNCNRRRTLKWIQNILWTSCQKKKKKRRNGSNQ